MEALTLTYLRRQCLRDLTGGALREPSGLALGPDGRSLWTVGDGTSRLFRLLLDERGDTPVRLDTTTSLDLGYVGLEGIAFKEGRTLAVIQEHDASAGTSTVLEHTLATGRTARHPLSGMRGYEALAGDLRGSKANKGLEGITWDSTRRRWLALKEGKPGMLLAISEDFRSLTRICELDKRAMGFAEKGAVDYSGMDHAGGDQVWIVSDKARAAFLFDVQALRVLRRFPLTWRKGSGERDRFVPVKKAEGVVYDAARARLHVVSDEHAEIYTYAVG